MSEPEKLYKDIFNTSPFLIGLINKEGNLININDKVEDFLSIHTKQQIIGKNFVGILSLNEKNKPLIPIFEKYFEKILKGEKQVSFDFKLYRSKEGYFWCRFDCSLVTLEEGDIIQFIIQDITEYKKIEQNLRKSEERFRSLFKGGPLFTMAWQKVDDNFILLDFNNNFLNTFSQVKDDLGSTASEMYLKRQYRPDIIEDLYRCFKEKSNFINEKKVYVDFLNRERDLRIMWSYVPPDLVLTFIEDITERKRAEQKLKESEAKFRTAFNSNVLSMSISTIEEGRFIEVNDVFLNDLGFTREEVIDKTSKELNIWANLSERDSIIKSIKEKGFVNNLEANFRTKKGEIKQGLFSVNKIFLNNIPYLLNIVNDITHFKIAERKLRESEEKFRTIAEQSLVGIGMIQDNYIKFVNQQTSNITGYTIEEILKWNLDDFTKIVHPEFRNLTIENMKRVMLDPEKLSVHYLNKGIKKSGEIIWVDTIIKKVTLNEKPAILGIFNDVTEKVIAERRIRESEKKFREAYNRAEFYKDLFAHDINNMLQSILSSNQLISMLSPSKEEKEKLSVFLDIINSEVNRGKKLVNSIKKLSQIEEKEIILEKVEIVSIITKIIGKIKDSVIDKDVQFQLDCKKEEFYVKANKLIKDVFQNLIINSIRHNRNDCVEILIKISGLKENGINYCKMEFIDNGIGIEDIRKKEIFFRSSSERMNLYGIGLGLTLVNKIIEAYNGKVWVEDRVRGDYSKGSNFIILIPEVNNIG